MNTDVDSPHTLIDAILGTFREPLGGDFEAYGNHCHRVAEFCCRLAPDAEQGVEKIAIAAAFHDLGIWTSNTWDYLPPSEALARTYLAETGREAWTDEIVGAIAWHHKITPARSSAPSIVEAFRRADLVDVSCGIVRHGLKAVDVRQTQRTYTDAGFHVRLLQLGTAGALRDPLHPLPMMKR